MVGDELTALQISQKLLRMGYHVPAIRPPTVPKGTSRLRCDLYVQCPDWSLRSRFGGLALPLGTMGRCISRLDSVFENVLARIWFSKRMLPALIAELLCQLPTRSKMLRI